MRLSKIFSLCLSFSMTGCPGKVPPVESCLYDEARMLFHCVSAAGNAFDMTPSDPKSDKLVCIPITDFGIVLNYCNGLRKP